MRTRPGRGGARQRSTRATTTADPRGGRARPGSRRAPAPRPPSPTSTIRVMGTATGRSSSAAGGSVALIPSAYSGSPRSIGAKRGERRGSTGHPAVRNPAETSRHYRPCHGDDLHRNREARRPPGPRRARPLLPDHPSVARRSSRELRGGLVTFFTMAYIVVLNPLIIGTQADSTGAFLGGGDINQAKLMVAAATALVAGRHDDPHGRRGELPPRARHRARAQRVRGVRHRQAARHDVGRRHGPGRHRGHHHHDPRAHRVPESRAAGRADPAQDRDLASASACSSRSSGWSTPGFVRKPTGPVPVELGIGGFLVGWPMLVFVVGPARDHRHDDPAGEGRHPHRHRRRPPSSRSSSRRSSRSAARPTPRARWSTRPAGASTSRPGRARVVDDPRLRAAGPVQPARLVQQDRVRRRGAARSSP